jgi:hypothetical protein
MPLIASSLRSSRFCYAGFIATGRYSAQGKVHTAIRSRLRQDLHPRLLGCHEGRRKAVDELVRETLVVYDTCRVCYNSVPVTLLTNLCSIARYRKFYAINDQAYSSKLDSIKLDARYRIQGHVRSEINNVNVDSKLTFAPYSTSRPKRTSNSTHSGSSLIASQPLLD